MTNDLASGVFGLTYAPVVLIGHSYGGLIALTFALLAIVLRLTQVQIVQGEVFAAATLGGAQSLGRDDIGRLLPGAKADIITIKLLRDDTLRFGPIRDPIKSLVECGIGDDGKAVGLAAIVVVAQHDEVARRLEVRAWTLTPLV